VAELETYSELEVSVLKAEYLAHMRKELPSQPDNATLADLALICLFEIMRDFPVRPPRVLVAPCQN